MLCYFDPSNAFFLKVRHVAGLSIVYPFGHLVISRHGLFFVCMVVQLFLCCNVGIVHQRLFICYVYLIPISLVLRRQVNNDSVACLAHYWRMRAHINLCSPGSKVVVMIGAGKTFPFTQ